MDWRQRSGFADGGRDNEGQVVVRRTTFFACCDAITACVSKEISGTVVRRALFSQPPLNPSS